MFGPLNGARITLVAAAGVAALVALILGYPLVFAVLIVGIAAHGGLWWWMYRHRPSGPGPTGPA